MKRPYIPLKVRLAVLLRQAFHGQDVELDHDPALELRRFNPRTGKYSPDANDPRFLIYRVRDEHLQKTTGRKPGAERTVTSKGSDVWLAKKFRKLESPKKVKRKMQSRPFPKRER